MSLANLPDWAACQLPAAAQIAACEEVEPGLVRVDLADGATAYLAKLGPAPHQPPALHGRPLDADETDTLARIARGHEYADIAIGVYGGLKTVKARLRRAYRKLGAHNSPHAVALAIATGQLPADVATPPPLAPTPTSEDAR